MNTNFGSFFASFKLFCQMSNPKKILINNLKFIKFGCDSCSFKIGLPGRPGPTGEKGESGRPGLPGLKGEFGEKGNYFVFQYNEQIYVHCTMYISVL